jgi:putative ABC transport system permease protein
MTRKQLRASIRWEAVIVALQGTILGLAIGAFFCSVTTLRDRQGTTVFSLPYLSLIEIVILGAAAGMLAAVMPAALALANPHDQDLELGAGHGLVPTPQAVG